MPTGVQWREAIGTHDGGVRASTAWAAAAVVATVALSACGTGDPDRPSSSAPPTSSTSARDGAATTVATTHTPIPPDGPGAPSDPSPESAAAVPPTEPAGAAGSASALAADITHIERVVRDPDTPEHRLARQAHRQQVAYRELALHPAWLDPVLDALPERLKDDALAQVAARQEFLDMQTTLADGPPEWHVTAPASAEDLLAWYQGAGDTYGVDWEVLAAINLIETAMGRIQSDSVAGAQGPMQFIPETWARWGNGDVRDPYHAIYGAARYLASSGAADGRLDDALFAYNNHNNYVRAVKRYADIMRRHPQLFRAFYHWQVYYRTDAGDLLLPEGYPDLPAVAR